MKKENNSEVLKLIELTRKFVDFAETLLKTGKITQEQYQSMTENKYRFLNDMERKKIISK
ncbi:MAG TPA: hypothetical protein PLL17_03955 [Defluviitaleaceae bacterium]|nr:hypothetical protein [Defluviitaleaceae bacterium]HPT76356.1 hypothetical protein [Defluviitaleaceae bacterium]HQD50269.1 hypothetical protein [Defluviitaleaceae bacterium]